MRHEGIWRWRTAATRVGRDVVGYTPRNHHGRNDRLTAEGSTCSFYGAGGKERVEGLFGHFGFALVVLSGGEGGRSWGGDEWSEAFDDDLVSRVPGRSQFGCQQRELNVEIG